MKTEIAPAFDADDRTYLFNCEVDFAVYDSEGTILFVEEMQRGDHHDTAEWMRKDALKRAALGLAGIPFRESFWRDQCNDASVAKPIVPATDVNDSSGA